MISCIGRSCNLCLSATYGVVRFVSDILERIVNKVIGAVAAIFLCIAETAASIANLAMQPIHWVVNLVARCFSTTEEGYRGVTINLNALGLAPDQMNLSAPNSETDSVNVLDLVDEYRRVERESQRLAGQGPRPASPDLSNTLRNLAHLSLSVTPFPQPGVENYNFLRQRASYDQLYYATMKKTLQRIILELRNPQVSVEKKKRALIALADGMSGCQPRKLEECQRQCRLLMSTAPEMHNLLLGYIQDLKEEIFLREFQGSQFHVLNYVRQEMGAEYGLNRSEINLRDPNIGVGGRPTMEAMRNVFESQYTTERLVQGVRTRIHLDENNSVWNAYIHTKLRAEAAARGENPDDPAVADRIVNEGTSFFDERLINERGVIFLLKSLGVVVPA